VEGFIHCVKSFVMNFNVSTSPSFILAKKLNLLQLKLKEHKKDVFRHLNTTMVILVHKVKLVEAKDQ